MLYAKPLKKHSFELWTANEVKEEETAVVKLTVYWAICYEFC